jgi:hypothetical protein|tara:strand:- start:58 stop:252 length:195 start_codon:yes stop_codon:yes gene_type:complete
MFKFLAGIATGWVAARSIPNKSQSPFDIPTYDEMILLYQRAKETGQFISKKIEEADKETKENDE